MPGYIKLYRDIQFNKIWQEKPFTRGQAWVDMLLRCNHVCVQMPPQYQNIWVLRGQFLLSNLKLAEAWGWDEKKVRRLMEYLVKESMIKYYPNNKFCVYEITKYAELQALDSELFELVECRTETLMDKIFSKNCSKSPIKNRTQTCNYQGLQDLCDENVPNKSRTKAEQKPTNKNDKNDKNNKNKDYIFHPPALDEVKAYCLERKKGVNPEKWFDFYSAKNWMIGKNKMKDWKAAVRTWEHNKENESSNPFSAKVPQQGNFDQRPPPTEEELEKFYKI